MQVITILVVQMSKYAQNGPKKSMIQTDCNRMSLVLTRTIMDRYYVHDKIVNELNRHCASIEQFAGGWIKLEVCNKRAVRDVTRRVDLIIEANKKAQYPQAEEPFSRSWT